MNIHQTVTILQKIQFSKKPFSQLQNYVNFTFKYNQTLIKHQKVKKTSLQNFGFQVKKNFLIPEKYSFLVPKWRKQKCKTVKSSHTYSQTI